MTIRRSVLLLACLVPLHAFADSKSKAQEHIDLATAAHQAGNYADALNELNIAYTLDPKPELLFAIGQLHVKLDQCPEAITFYERFLATNPDQESAGEAAEAIGICKQRGTHVEPVTPPPPPPRDVPTPTPTPPAPPQPTEPGPFYTDVLGDGFLVGGIAFAVGCALEYRSAMNELDLAESAASYNAQVDQLADANSKRTLGIGLGLAGGVLIGLAVFRYVQTGRNQRSSTMAIVPTPGGAGMTWATRF